MESACIILAEMPKHALRAERILLVEFTCIVTESRPADTKY